MDIAVKVAHRGAPSPQSTIINHEVNRCCICERPPLTALVFSLCVCVVDEIDMLERLWLSGICHNDKIEVRRPPVSKTTKLRFRCRCSVIALLVAAVIEDNNADYGARCDF